MKALNKILESLTPHAIDALDVFYLAGRCLAAQWLGIGKPSDFCGTCIYCMAARYALVGFAFVTVYLIAPGLLFGAVGIWAAWSVYNGKGWLGAYIHARLWARFVIPPTTVAAPPPVAPNPAPRVPPIP